jgi:hypothetical protein
MKQLLLAFLLAAEASAGSAQSIVHWTFDRTTAPVSAVSIQPHDAPAGVPRQTSFRNSVPGRFIYDPLTQTSRTNQASLPFGGSGAAANLLAFELDFQKAGLAGQSLTLEAFVKPSTNAFGNAWLAGKSRTTEAGSELSLEWHELPNSGQTWHGAAFATPGTPPRRFAVGHYSSSTRLQREVDDWRHVAVVYDAATGSVTCWVDYHLTRTESVATPLAWDAGPFRIGAPNADRRADGLLDEIRLTRGALGPAQFLRARNDAITGVTFVSSQQIVPRDAGCFDAKEHFGAAGDGTTDDTDALNAAFAHLTSKVPLAYNTLLLPPGTYLVSGVLHCSRFIDVKGAGPDLTTIRLKDGTFTDAARPQPVLRMSSTSGDPGSHPWVNGSSISIYLDGVTIDTGRGNPGAKALEFHANNIGRLENVVLRSGDSSGVLGLDLTHHDVGPALIKHVRIEGFDVGAAIRYQEYSMTFEHVTLRGQRVAGIRNQGNILAIRGLLSDNRVPALIAEGANSMVTLLDSRLSGGAPDQPAIQSDGALYVLRLKTSGYGQAIAKRTPAPDKPGEWTTQRVAGPNLEEYVGDRIVTGFGQATGSLKLPIEETPEPPLPPIRDWVNVETFASRKSGDDWSPVVQAAIDSGARLIYVPRHLPLEFQTPIRLHGNVQRLMGFGADWNWSRKVWKNEGQREQTNAAAAPPPLIIFDDPEPHRVVVLDRLGCVHIRHASPSTLVLRSSSPDRYSTGTSGGRLFAEDVGGADWHFDHPQRVWVRQWNPESHAAGPCILSRGATLWSLGFKTEYESQKVLAENGARTEILGSFIYPIGKIPSDRPIFENRDSAMSLVYGASIYHSNHKVQIRDVKRGDVKTYGDESLTWSGSRGRMDLFTTDAR